LYAPINIAALRDDAMRELLEMLEGVSETGG
jgi:hypothetical protein